MASLVSSVLSPITIRVAVACPAWCVVRGAWSGGLELKKLVFRAMGDLSTQAGGELAWVLALVMLSMILLSVVLLSVILLSVVLRSLSLFVLMHITKQMILPFINRCT